MRKSLLISLVILTLLFIDTFSQGGGSAGIGDARSTALGKSYTVATRGIYSVGRNPANLAYKSDHTIELAAILPLPNFNANFSNSMFSFKDINFLFGGVKDSEGNRDPRFLSEDDKIRVRNSFKNGGKVTTTASATLFALYVNPNRNTGAFAFTINDRSATNSRFSEDFIDFALFGNDLDRTYDFGDNDFSTWYLREYSFSYGRFFDGFLSSIFEDFSVGVSIKYIHGFWYAGMEKFESRLTTLDDNALLVQSDILFYSAVADNFGVEYDFEDKRDRPTKFDLFPSPVGEGLGFDAGVSAAINDVWTLGVAVTDIGKINWNKNAVEYSAADDQYLLEDVTVQSNVDSVRSLLRGKGKYIDEFSTGLATAFRVGFSCRIDRLSSEFPGEMLLVAEYNQGFNDLPSNSTNPRISFGAEWLLGNFIAIRNGFSFGGIDEVKWGFGLGFNFGLLDVGIASPDMASLFLVNNSKRAGFAFSSRLKF